VAEEKGEEERTHLFIRRPAMAIGVCFLVDVPVEIIEIKNTDD